MKPFSRCAGEGLIPNLAARDGKEALLPFTGEGARRADEGARAQRSVPLILAWEGQQQLAALAPSSGAARHLLPLRRRRADPEPCGESWEGSPSPASQEKGWIHWRGKAWRRKPFSRCAGEGLIQVAPQTGVKPLSHFAVDGRCRWRSPVTPS